MKRFNLAWLGCVLWLCVGAFGTRAQHGHINAGALQPVAGSPLYFANGFNFLTNSGYAQPLKLETNGPFAGVYRGSILFTSLPATENYGGPAFGHAASGAHLELRVESVKGPTGGAFHFYENDEGELGSSITFSVPTGERRGTQQFVLSENDGSQDSDPYGHIHGRSFGATAAGLYEVGFRILDTSANGPGGTPLHPLSDLYSMFFQAGVTIAWIELREAGVGVTFAAMKNGRYQVETATDLAGPWASTGDVLVGRDHLETVLVPYQGTAYFRLRAEGL